VRTSVLVLIARWGNVTTNGWPARYEVCGVKREERGIGTCHQALE